MYNKVRLRFHLKITEETHKEFKFGGKLYSSLNSLGFVTLEYMDGQYDYENNTTSVMITDKSIYGLLTALKDAINNLYTYDIYYKENGELRMYEEEANKYSIAKRLYGGGAIMLRPTIVYDENETSYEGISLCVNTTNNRIDLPLETLEALYYTLTKVDFFIYTQSLLTYYITYYNIDEENTYVVDNTALTLPKPKVDWLNEQHEEPKVEVTSTFRKQKDEFSAMFDGTL